MANVLGTLFQNIANAIRNKTGDTASMKPAEFPDKIAAIVTGSGGSDGEWITAKGTANSSTGDPITVEHGLGVVPDIIFMTAGVAGTMSDSTNSKMSAVCGFLMSEKLMSGTEDDDEYGYVFLFTPSASGGMVGRSMVGLEKATENGFNCVCKITANTMQLGTQYAYLLPNITYSWRVYARK